MVATTLAALTDATEGTAMQVRDTETANVGNGVAVIQARGPRSDVVTVGLDREAPMHEGSRRAALQQVAKALGLDFEAEALGRLPSVRPATQGGRW